MTSHALHPLAADYVERLRTAARDLPRARRDELVAEIEAHLAEVIPPNATDADALNELNRLGEPGDIVEAERPTPTPATTPAARRGGQEWTAIALLLAGGFLCGVGWFIGVLMLWTSHAWTRRDKLIGTLIVPGGLALAWVVLGPGLISVGEVCFTDDAGHDSCGNGATTVGDVLFVVLLAVSIIGPFATATYLAIRAGRTTRLQAVLS